MKKEKLTFEKVTDLALETLEKMLCEDYDDERVFEVLYGLNYELNGDYGTVYILPEIEGSGLEPDEIDIKALAAFHCDILTGLTGTGTNLFEGYEKDEM